MNKLPLAALLLMLSLTACTLPLFSSPTPTASPSPSPTLTFTPRPTATSTSTPTPTITPTPAPEARVAEADHSLFNGDYQSALDGYTNAWQGTIDQALQASALLGQGRTHYLSGVYANALNELRAVIDQYPSSSQAADAWYFLAETLFQLGRYAESADAFAKYLQARPGVLDAFINERRGDALSATGDLNAALEAYTRAVQSPRLPTDFSLELKIAQTDLSLGDYATAGVIYDDIFNRTSSESIKGQVDFARAQMYTALNQPDQATTAYVDAVFNYPHAYYSYLALVQLVNSAYPVSELQRGLVDYYAGEYIVALAAFDRYLSTASDDRTTALYFKGLILRDQESYPQAITAWDEVIQAGPGSAMWDAAWEQKAYTQWAYLGDFVGGGKTLLDFVAAVPTHPRAAEFLFDAGRVAERDDRLKEAATTWQRIAAEYPSSDYVYRALFLAGICYYRLADYADAQTVFWQAHAVAAKPGDRAGANFWVAKSQAAQGDAVTSKTTFSQTIAIDPTGYYSERARDELAGRAPFTPPGMTDLRVDRTSERKQAELWMQTTFNYPGGTDFSVPGPLASDPRFMRGTEFWHLGLEDHAEAEFSDLRQSAASDPLLSYRLAVYLSDLGLYRQAIMSARQVLDLAGLDDAGTLTAPLLFSHIRFGAFYPELVIAAAQENGFEPLFAWSVLRQESLFDPTILSSAGAYGLMQLLPSTGQEVVSRLGWPPDYTTADLLRPQVNIRLGMDYLATQRAALGGDLLAALAAYNGGFGNAASWQSLARGDPDLFVEIVRFDETRQYLMGIYEVYTIYSRLYARVP